MLKPTTTGRTFQDLIDKVYGTKPEPSEDDDEDEDEEEDDGE
jgi:hypothetical protein